jgi:DNA-binding NtrC family response regulator
MATVLVVDDEEGLRTSLAKILRRAGHTVVTGSNGLEGIALYRSSPDVFDIVVTDLEMPTLDGYQLMKLVLESNNGAKIICMSGGIAKAIPANAKFLQKPFPASTLCALVDKMLY